MYLLGSPIFISVGWGLAGKYLLKNQLSFCQIMEIMVLVIWKLCSWCLPDLVWTVLDSELCYRWCMNYGLPYLVFSYVSERYHFINHFPSYKQSCRFWSFKLIPPRGGVRSMRGLGPTMTAWGQSIGISTAMLPQTLIVSRIDQLSRLGARI